MKVVYFKGNKRDLEKAGFIGPYLKWYIVWQKKIPLDNKVHGYIIINRENQIAIEGQRATYNADEVIPFIEDLNLDYEVKTI